jgi:hypothetical protein
MTEAIGDRDMSDEPEPTMTRAELEQLVAAANRGEQEAKTKLIAWLDANPAAWQSVGDVASRSETAIRNAIAAGDFLQAECVRRAADALRQSLLVPDANVLEKLCVERLVITWLQMQLLELRMATIEGGRISSGTFWTKALTAAHNRFAGALNQLLAIQKVLGRPSCRAAIADVFAGGPQVTATAGKAEPPMQQATGEPSSAKPPVGNGGAAAADPAAAMPGGPNSNDRGQATDEAIDISGLLPFRIREKSA